MNQSQAGIPEVPDQQGVLPQQVQPASSGSAPASSRIMSIDARMNIACEECKFSDPWSLLDYDIVFWDPESSIKNYQTLSSYIDGYPKLSDEDSARATKMVQQRKREFSQFLALGRTIVVFLPHDVTRQAYTGKNEYSGTGKNRQTIKLYRSLDLLKSIPGEWDWQLHIGFELTPVASTLAKHFQVSGDRYMYARTLPPSDDLIPLVTVTGSGQIAGGWTDKFGGTLIFLPNPARPEPSDDDSENSAEDSDGESSQYVTEESDKLADAQLLSWLVEFTRRDVVDKPEWLDQYLLPTERVRHEQMMKVRAEIERYQQELHKLEFEDAADAQWKILLYGSGTMLEDQVRLGLAELGFVIADAIRGRADIRGSLDGENFVVEVKGLSKSSGEKNAAQLEKWVAEEKVANRDAKGILVIVGWNSTPPKERQHPVFPDQMLAYSIARNHCLVTGSQLLGLVLTARRQPERRTELARILMDTVGTVDGWDAFELLSAGDK